MEMAPCCWCAGGRGPSRLKQLQAEYAAAQLKGKQRRESGILKAAKAELAAEREQQQAAAATAAKEQPAKGPAPPRAADAKGQQQQKSNRKQKRLKGAGKSA